MKQPKRVSSVTFNPINHAVAPGAELDSDSQDNLQDYEPTTKRGHINQDDVVLACIGEYYETDCKSVARQFMGRKKLYPDAVIRQ